MSGDIPICLFDTLLHINRNFNVMSANSCARELPVFPCSIKASTRLSEK